MRLRINADFEKDELDDMFIGLKRFTLAAIEKLENDETLKDKEMVTYVLPVGTIQVGRTSDEFESVYDAIQKERKEIGI